MIHRFATAWTFLTVIPFGWRRPDSTRNQDLARSLVAFPAVGLVLGVALAGTSLVVDRLFPHALAVIIVVVLSIWVTGGLHLDGVADTADACGARSGDDALRIMKGSTIGTYGTLALVAAVGLKIAGLTALPSDRLAGALVAMPVLGRWVMVQMTTGHPPARSEGLAHRATGGARRADHVAATAIALPIVALAMGLQGLLGAAVVWVATLWFGRWVTRWLGGVTGDTIGAAGEGCEVLAVLMWSAIAHIETTA
jgi:adenosylcobinamide-GDP ribazoletransferase